MGGSSVQNYTCKHIENEKNGYHIAVNISKYVLVNLSQSISQSQ